MLDSNLNGAGPVVGVVIYSFLIGVKEEGGLLVAIGVIGKYYFSLSFISWGRRL